MINKAIEEQLKKVENADLSNFDPATNSYLIPKKTTIKIEENSCYIFQLKDSAFTNNTININWNGNRGPLYYYYKADVIQKMPGMIKILGVAYNINTGADLNSFWTGWLSLNDVIVLQRL